jgi:predicted ATPase
VVFETAGAAARAAFAAPAPAVAAALAGQLALQREAWSATGPLRARMGVHPGEVEARPAPGAAPGARYSGPPLARCVRLTAAAHGGQVVLSDAAAAPVRGALPAGAGLRDLGTHRLQDLRPAARVAQLTHPGLPAAFPPLRALEALPHNLPLQLTSFVGRAGPLREVERLLAGGRLLTLTGAGGVGKTRLALQAAADASGAYPDGVWLAALAALADAALVPETVAAAVGVREEPGRPLLGSLTDALRPKRLLLVLDNCEHLLDACAALADALLRACPHLHILATSREALGIAGETVWRVPSLSLPDAGDPAHPAPPAALTQSEAVRLFLDRAVGVQPAFRVTTQNAPAVAQICARLDGIPLAIELAPARVRVLPPAQLLARLEDRFRLLTSGSRTAPERHQTLRAAVDWSYGLLSEAERRLFARLSVFAGGWSLEAAEAVCAEDPLAPDAVLDVLTRLVDKSLVVVDAQPDGTARYRLLETLRLYAGEKLLTAAGATAVRTRHRDYFLAWAERAGPGLHGRDHRAWLGRFDAEQDNLRAALAWSHDDPGGAEAGLRLGAAVEPYWMSRGLVTEGRRWVEAALERGAPGDGSRGDGRPPARAASRAAALAAAGLMAGNQGDLRRARPFLEAAAAHFRALGDARGLAGVLGVLAAAACLAGDYRMALDRDEEAVALARRSGDRRALAGALSRYGGHLVRAGDYAAGRRASEEALRVLRELGDGADAGPALDPLTLAAMGEGDLARARALLEERLAAAEAAGQWRTAGFCLTRLGHVARRAGDLAGARRRLAAGLPRSRDAGDRPNILVALDEWAGLAAAEGRPVRAARLFGAAQALLAAAGLARHAYLRATYGRDLAATRAALGPTAFDAAWAAGAAMTLEQAVADALEDAADAA